MTTTTFTRGSWSWAGLVVCFAISALLSACSVSGAPVAAPGFEGTEVMLPARDGVKLRTVIYSPVGSKDNLPILFLRTPYGVDGRASLFQTSFKELAGDGYIFALQDIRGKFGSEGEFAMIRPLRHPANPKAIDEGTDAFDSIDWLLKNVRGHNGRVGMLGVSYD